MGPPQGSRKPGQQGLFQNLELGDPANPYPQGEAPGNLRPETRPPVRVRGQSLELMRRRMVS